MNFNPQGSIECPGIDSLFSNVSRVTYSCSAFHRLNFACFPSKFYSGQSLAGGVDHRKRALDPLNPVLGDQDEWFRSVNANSQPRRVLLWSATVVDHSVSQHFQRVLLFFSPAGHQKLNAASQRRDIKKQKPTISWIITSINYVLGCRLID